MGPTEHPGATPAEWDALSRAAGIGAILPVVCDPGAVVSPQSALKAGDLGKIPSRIDASGRVRGIPKWPTRNTTAPEVARWSKNPAHGIGIRTGDVIAIDCDIEDPELATQMRETVIEYMPAAPIRDRKGSTRFLAAFRVTGDPEKIAALRKRKSVIGPKDAVELLAHGQHFVAAGMHIKSGMRYQWDGGTPQVFPEYTVHGLGQCWDALVAIRGVDATGSPPQTRAASVADGAASDFVTAETLRDLRSALSQLDPNVRDVWIRAGLALRALGPDGFELWEPWSRLSPKHVEGEPEAIWAGFEPQGIGYRTVFKDAAAAGWVNPRAGKAPSPPAPTGAKPQPSLKTAEALMKKVIRPLVWILPGLLPEGVSILAAAPKIGKSWFAMQLIVAVASGRSMFSRDVQRGGALGLFLEDGDRRLQDRFRKLQIDTLSPEAQRRIEIATEWPRVDQGGVQHLDVWLSGNPDTRLVVIDVLEKFRAPRSAKGQIYTEDYEALRLLKQLAEKHRIAILLVHHTRKSFADDIVETVSGSMGLTGAADAVLVLKRGRGEAAAELHVTGRDLDSDGYYAVTFDRESCSWSLAGPRTAVTLTTERAAILKVLTEDGPRTPSEIGLKTGKSRENVAKMLRGMQESGCVSKIGRGRYEVATLDVPGT